MKTKATVHRLPLTKARINLGSLIRRIHLKKEYVILEKDGIPVAGIMDIDEMQDYLEMKNPGMKMQVAEGYAAYRKGDVREASSFLAELRGENKGGRKKVK